MTNINTFQGDVGIDRDQKFDFGAGYNSNWYIKQKSADNKIYFERTGGGGNELVIDTAGNVGVGTASPSEKFHVHENISTSGHQIIARVGGSTSSYNTLILGSKEGRPHIGGHRGDFGAWADLSLQNDVMVIQQGGKVGITGYLKTGNPAFYVHKTGAGPSDNSYITYDASLANLGNNMNVGAGIFTCPVAGIYTFTWGALANNSNHVYRYYIRKNDSNIGDIHLRLDNTASGSEFGDGERTVMLSLSTNDTIRIHYQDSNGSDADYGYNYTYLQGYLISYT
jgi:hypothetical protein